MASAANETLRDNAFYMSGSASKYPAWGAQISSRGSNNIAPTGVEAYNNTCYAPNAIAGQVCIGFDNATQPGGAPGSKSFGQNNLFYAPATGHSTVINKGSGNTVSNNSATPSNNPRFTNASGSYHVISDYQPNANFSGGTSVPVWYDALGLSWSSWVLGAVQ